MIRRPPLPVDEMNAQVASSDNPEYAQVMKKIGAAQAPGGSIYNKIKAAGGTGSSWWKDPAGFSGLLSVATAGLGSPFGLVGNAVKGGVTSALHGQNPLRGALAGTVGGLIPGGDMAAGALRGGVSSAIRGGNPLMGAARGGLAYSGRGDWSKGEDMPGGVSRRAMPQPFEEPIRMSPQSGFSGLAYSGHGEFGDDSGDVGSPDDPSLDTGSANDPGELPSGEQSGDEPPDMTPGEAPGEQTPGFDPMNPPGGVGGGLGGFLGKIGKGIGGAMDPRNLGGAMLDTGLLAMLANMFQQKRKPFTGAADPQTIMSGLMPELQGQLAHLKSVRDQGIQLPDAYATPPPAYSGGALPFPIGNPNAPGLGATSIPGVGSAGANAPMGGGGGIRRAPMQGVGDPGPGAPDLDPAQALRLLQKPGGGGGGGGPRLMGGR